ncbi:hypothetical protein NQ315_001715 [Exocentrus adspersus]|uniref:Tetratricopeptide repeat protein 39C n=1 Tax=Exocentrus adspersus TaxID=1586481 RepID=A0AAV8W966_9CUCU|nr:hypothetical protein NQ315_001715 [Exocentrus adspersus]
MLPEGKGPSRRGRRLYPNDALMSFEDDKINLALSTLKEVERRCLADTGWFKNVIPKVFGTNDPTPTKPLAEQLETQIILADSQVCLALLTFLQQDFSGYLKCGWVLRKAWKVYQRVYKDILVLYKEQIGELQLPDPSSLTVTPAPSTPLDRTPSDAEWNIPESSNGKENNHFLKKSTSINNGLASGSLWSSFGSLQSFALPLHIFSSQSSIKNQQEINKEVVERLMGAVCFGYGLFQLGISLLPPSLLKLCNILGFAANRQNGISCLMYSRLGVDMRAPLATLALLWYHTIVRPFYAIDGTNVQAGVDSASMLINESHKEFEKSALFLFFSGRVSRLNSDIKSALKSFKEAAENATQRELKLLSLHEVGWCHLIELDYCAAECVFTYLHSSSRWSKSFYAYLAAVCSGACSGSQRSSTYTEMKDYIKRIPKATQLDEFLNRRSKYFPENLEEIKSRGIVYWKLLVFEMLYLWNALPSCSTENISRIISDCTSTVPQLDEPMVGLSNLILGCAYGISGQVELAIDSFRKCLDKRSDLAPNAEDLHVSAFAQYELGVLLLRTEETKAEGRLLLQGISQYTRYDFEQKLTVRVYSLLRQSS